MSKRLFSLFLIFCFSCAEQGNKESTEKGNAASNPPAAAATRLSDEAALEVLAGCVDNARESLGEANAYALCKCVLQQVQEKYPGADSTAIVNHLSDTTEVARMAKNCQ